MTENNPPPTGPALLALISWWHDEENCDELDLELIGAARLEHSRLVELLVDSSKLFRHVGKAFEQNWCIDWNELEQLADKIDKALGGNDDKAK